MRDELLIEVGTEEMPALAVRQAVEQLERKVLELLGEERFRFSTSVRYATPRRLAVRVLDVDGVQADLELTVKGPPASVAFDGGNPTAAAYGFARSQGVELSDLEVVETGNGSYVFAKKRIPGRSIGDVIGGRLGDLILSLSFPKDMAWGEGDIRFVRPIRWLVAMFGGEVIPVAIGGVRSGKETMGHRFLSPGRLVLSHPRQYEATLRDNWVVADPEERKRMVREQVEKAAIEAGGEALIRDELLEEVTFLVEFPTAFVGKFSEDYLDMPSEVLTTAMMEHQRYFPVFHGNRLLAAFVGVRNGGTDGIDLVRSGNERVLRARLADARFFFEEDRKVPLQDRLDELKKMVFQEKLGTLYDKTMRISRLSDGVGRRCGLTPHERAVANRAALLCKCDLVTHMVGEFPELQGVMGREYARESGESEEVAIAIYEHYMPRFAGDAIPGSSPGKVVSLADKLDTITGIFSAGIQPSGSQDPYGVRRQAYGIIYILKELEGAPSLSELIRESLEEYLRNGLIRQEDLESVSGLALEFFVSRLRIALHEEGFRHDLVEAVLSPVAKASSEGLRVHDVWRRVGALSEVLKGELSDDVLTVHRRASRLSRGFQEGGIRVDMFETDEEVRLHDAIKCVTESGLRAFKERDYLRYFREIASLRPAVDSFFDKVMVMVEDDELRTNRLSMLKAITFMTTLVADLDLVVV